MFDHHRQLADSIEVLDRDQKEIFYSALNIHGHACGGMPMGFAAGMAALEALGIERERNMDTMAVMEIGNAHAAGCFADGVQFATGATFGKGVMRKDPKGKWAFKLIHKPTGRAVKVRIRNEVLDKAFAAPFITEYRIKGVNPTDIPAEVGDPAVKRPFGMKFEDMFIIEGPFDIELPKVKPCFERVTCTGCGATVAENYAHYAEGKPYCVDCTPYGS